MFLIPRTAHSSTSSAIVDDGVIGKIAHTSLTQEPTWTTAVFPSIVVICLAILVASYRLRRHLDCVAGALLEAGCTARTFRIIVTIPPTGPELDDRVFRTSGVTVVALIAIAA